MLFAIVLGAVIGAAASFLLRSQLGRLSLLTWIGWLLVGTGMPVLIGQLGFLALASDTSGGPDPAAPFILVTGFCAGLGWAFITAGLRLTRRRS
ncbi:MAG: hypothetical protein HLUCCA04_09120 [Oceanicaulis sp. HLUCCA04]|nr:MAG: hypothetical protein HLUCCA04_09120 [Oceanicaulis sp. HLUCCA04]